jgi:hypothetical protein
VPTRSLLAAEPQRPLLPSSVLGSAQLELSGGVPLSLNSFLRMKPPKRSEPKRADFSGLMLRSPFLEMAWHSSGAMASRERWRFFRPRDSGGGDHWSSRSERTVVEGAQDAQLRCRCKKNGAMKLLLSRVKEKRAHLKSAYDVDSCVALTPAPPPPPCFAG